MEDVGFGLYQYFQVLLKHNHESNSRVSLSWLSALIALSGGQSPKTQQYQTLLGGIFITKPITLQVTALLLHIELQSHSFHDALSHNTKKQMKCWRWWHLPDNFFTHTKGWMDNKMELSWISTDVRSLSLSHTNKHAQTLTHANIINLIFVNTVTSRFVIIKTVIYSLPFACSAPVNVQLCDLLNNYTLITIHWISRYFVLAQYIWSSLVKFVVLFRMLVYWMLYSL
jgi:hypothetical protein